jgi:short-subunit dehydrogenase
VRIEGARALVVGSSSGIGRALSEELNARGARVAATARRRDSLAALAEVGIEVASLDVTDDLEVQALVARSEPEVLVCNAGFGADGVIEEVDDDTLRMQYEVNVFGVWRLTRAALPAMRRRRSGAIVVIGSFGSVMPYPGIGAYRSSKAAVRSICWALHLEVAGFGIRVLHVMPGLTRSRFEENMVSGARVDHDGPYREVYAQAADAYRLMSPEAAEPGEVARHVLDELTAGGDVVDLIVGDDAERMVSWVAGGERIFFEHVADDLGYAWHRQPRDSPPGR